MRYRPRAAETPQTSSEWTAAGYAYSRHRGPHRRRGRYHRAGVAANLVISGVLVAARGVAVVDSLRQGDEAEARAAPIWEFNAGRTCALLHAGRALMLKRRRVIGFGAAWRAGRRGEAGRPSHVRRHRAELVAAAYDGRAAFDGETTRHLAVVRVHVPPYAGCRESPAGARRRDRPPMTRGEANGRARAEPGRPRRRRGRAGPRGAQPTAAEAKRAQRRRPKRCPCRNARRRDLAAWPSTRSGHVHLSTAKAPPGVTRRRLDEDAYGARRDYRTASATAARQGYASDTGESEDPPAAPAGAPTPASASRARRHCAQEERRRGPEAAESAPP